MQIFKNHQKKIDFYAKCLEMSKKPVFLHKNIQ